MLGYLIIPRRLNSALAYQSKQKFPTKEIMLLHNECRELFRTQNHRIPYWETAGMFLQFAQEAVCQPASDLADMKILLFGCLVTTACLPVCLVCV